MNEITAKVIPPAEGYLVGAISAFNGLQVIDETQRLDPFDKIRNSTILAALALECALKHHLAKSGIPEKEVRNHKHDLAKLWVASHEVGLNIVKEPPDWCKTLSSTTSPPLFFMRYNYGAAGAIVLPSEFLVTVIDQLIRIIYPDLRPLLPRADGRPRLMLPPNVSWIRIA